ncbi:hypothetical protein ENHYDAX1_220282 [Enhydrobacter sp. AX1]|nr:hypothetical protein ENHYDAX1_220282 [Enhydrobacter sp. AX1]
MAQIIVSLIIEVSMMMGKIVIYVNLCQLQKLIKIHSFQ